MQLDLLIDSITLPYHPMSKDIGLNQMTVDVKKHSGQLERLGRVMEFASRSLGSRISVQQLLFFTRVAEAHANGHSLTVSDIRERDDLGQSLIRTHLVFLKPSHQVPEALGWIELEEDTNDRRRKILKLTETGKEIAAEFARRII